jgi:hypothetical protein
VESSHLKRVSHEPHGQLWLYLFGLTEPRRR